VVEVLVGVGAVGLILLQRRGGISSLVLGICFEFVRFVVHES
jgi:hypothetical protein